MKPFLSLRKNGVWYIVDRKKSRGRAKWISTREKDRDEAEKMLDCYIAEQRADELESPSGAPRLSQYAEEFLAHAETKYAIKTIRLYKDALEDLMEHVGDIPLDMVTVRNVDKFMARRAKKVKPITVNKELSTLKAAFNQAIRWEYIEKNPFTGTKRLRVPEKAPVYFTREEYAVLLAGIQGHWLSDLVIVAMNTGLRQGELLTLTWQNVDLDRKIIRVVNTATFRTKTGKHRIVPLNAVAIAVLEERQKLREAYVFTLDGGQVKSQWVTHLFKKTIRRLGMRDELHFHSLRHTFASYLVQSGVSLYQVGKLLGHRDMKSTEVYAHLQPDMMHDIVDRLTLP